MFNWDETGFYRGCTPLKTNSDKKEPIIPYTKESVELQTARGYQSYSGILAYDTALYDADDSQNSELLLKIIKGEELKCLVSDREGGQGIHSLFFYNGELCTATKVMLACGIVVDIKLGKRNGLECLKWKGVERNVIYNEAPYQTVPKYFKPLKGCVIDFQSMESGDGRNSTLFSYILTLQKEGFTVEEIRECIRIINKYVLKEPVSDKELDVILRDGAFKKKAFFKGKTFLHDQFAEHIKNTYHIKKINGQLHIYQDGVYVSGTDEIEKAMYKEISSLTDAKRKEVLKQLNLICDEISIDDSTAHLIAFRNGIYDLETDSLKPFSPDIVITNRIPWDYNPTAYSELADKTLDKIACQDKQVRTILEECIGSCFYRSNTLGGGKAFILTGEGSNGKSTFIEVLQYILGEKNYSVLDFKDLADRFSTVMMFGKLANLGDDISSDFNQDVSVFKKITRGNEIDAQQKGQPKFQFKPYCKLIFSANTIPRMKDDTGAAQNRLIIIPFNAIFSKSDDDYNPTIKFDLITQASIEYFILIGLQGLKRIVENRQYSSSMKVEKELEEYRIENNPVLSFINEVGVDAIENEPTSAVYTRYSSYCAENGFRALSNNIFPKQLKRLTGFEIGYAKDTNRKTIKIYVFKENEHS